MLHFYAIFYPQILMKTHKSEWEYAVAEAAAPGYLSVAGGFFANSVSNDGEGGGESPYALPPNGSPDDFENSCTRRVALSVRNVDNVHHNLTVTARVVTPDGDQCVVVGEGQTKSFPIGTEVHVQASDASWFSGWYASGTLLSGSRNAKDSFTLTTSTEVIAYVKGTYQLEYVYNPYTRVEVSVAGGDDPLVLGHSEGYIGNRSIHYRSGTHLMLNAVSTSNGDEWLKVYSDYGNPAINQKSTATIDPDGATFVEVLSGSALYGYGEFKIEMSNGYGTVDFGTTSRPNFLDSVSYALPNPATAPWYKTTHPDAYPDPGYYPRSFDTANVTNSSPNVTASVEIRPTSQLTMKPAECLKNCTANVHGVTTFLNARHDYYGPTMHIDNAELVGIVSAPDEFHKFIGFKVSGGANVYKWSGGGVPDDFFDLDGFDEAEEENGLYAYDPIYIEMSQDVSVTPIYSLSTPKSTIFQPSEMCYSNSPWGPMHIATGCNGDSITLECDGDYFYRKGETEIGHCLYFGGQNWFGFEYIESAGGDLLWAGMQITQDNACLRQVDERNDAGVQYAIDYTVYYVPFYPASESFSIPPTGAVSIFTDCNLNLYDVGYLDPEDRSAWQ